ncbi:hypothetical protein BDV26DRAFT_186494 [Aspergillus bertholletiae]|uniref:Endoplasmic reticulum junction formation protein lunapark n=1 Tax=Aspergillus bertholletiae TaxID=1226010 RepID=A0A5N7BA67_9EURO|nr:hypothetical protein BDV26DRAFT_186494 [Aspergillus bertholletiae]
MVSLWPFKGEDNSPASFERALEALSGKITRANTRLDAHRQNARRFKALWTLYTSFAYLLYSIILALVLGWQNFGAVEYIAIAGGPIVIYVVRAAGSKYFGYRINSTQRYLDGLQKQRDETIEKLKVATKYNSTQQLLEKYGGVPKRTKSKSGDDKRKSDSKRKSLTPQQQQPPVQRTGLPPPPTANIRRPTPIQSPGAPSPDLHAPPSPYPPQPQIQQQPVPPPGPTLDEPGFAPNAFPSAPPYTEESHWYDRLMDVLLGEDETQPKNRIVLICNSCRLVNGQAPPGIKTLEEIGRWRCGNCGAWNGVESEAKKVLDSIQNESQRADGAWEPVSKMDADNHSSVGDVTDDGVMVATSEDDQVESPDSDADTAEKEPVQVEEEQPEPKSKTRPVRRSNRKKT